MRILVLNWRDIKNPKSGGAEVLTHEMAKHWSMMGHRVTLFSSSFNGSSSPEMIDNVRIIRRGNPDARFLFTSVHFLAFLYYLRNSRDFDVVLDEIHGIPFFTPWYVKTKKVVLICEVAGDLWKKMFGSFFGMIGQAIEQLYLNYVYKGIPYLTISKSTKEELVKEGVDAKSITVLPMGVTVPKKIKEKWIKEESPTLIFVGRLSKSKGIEDAILAVREVSKRYPSVRFWVVGGGEEDYLNYLKKLSKKYKLDNKITFFGFVPEEKKFELMGRSHILVAPSMKEGWGLTVPEAGRVLTPAVGYNVEGLREVIVDGKTGYLTSKNNFNELAKEIRRLLSDKKTYNKLAKAAKDLSLSYNWESTAKTALEVMKK